MKSSSKKDFAPITNVNDKFLNELEEKLHFKSDKRIKFVGTVYNSRTLEENPREFALRLFSRTYRWGDESFFNRSSWKYRLKSSGNLRFNKEVAEQCVILE